MSIYRVSTNIAYDHEQGMFMFFIDGDLKKLPSHFITRFESGEDNVIVVCETKYHKERMAVASDSPVSDTEKLTILLEDF